MSRNGSGTYSLYVGVNPVVTGTTITSAWANNTLNDLASAMTASIANDGQTPILANLPMSTFRHTGCGNAVARTDYAATGQVQDGTFIGGGTAGGSANALTITLAPVITAYATGQIFSFIPASNNTAATTINVSGVGAKNLFWNGVACVGGELQANIPAKIFYDGTQFHLIGNGFAAPFLDTNPVVVGSSDSTRKLRFECDNITSGNTRTLVVPDASGTILQTGTTVLTSQGGTGQASYTVGDLLYASGTTTLSKLAASTSGFILTANGAGVAPSWTAAGNPTGSQLYLSVNFGAF